MRRVLQLLSYPLTVPLLLVLALVLWVVFKFLLRSGERARVQVARAEDAPAIRSSDELPMVSVIIPMYNAEVTLKDCLDSVVQQNFPQERLDIIVVDNGSQDQSLSIAKEYPVRVLQEQVRGAGPARNRGIKEARGEWIALLDADCVAEKDWLNGLWRTVKETGAVIVGGEIKNRVGEKLLDRFVEDEGILSQRAALAGKMLRVPFVITANMLVWRKVFDEVGYFDEKLRAVEDVEWSWRALRRGCEFAFSETGMVWHLHRLRGRDMFLQFLKYGRSEPLVFVRYKDLLERNELWALVFMDGWRYRRLVGKILLFPFRMVVVKRERQLLDWWLVVKELGHLWGKVLTYLERPGVLVRLLKA